MRRAGAHPLITSSNESGGDKGFLASIALTRLDERLRASPSSIRKGWIRRALLHEAAASVRLEGHYVPVSDLLLALHDTLDRVGDQDLSRALETHQMLGAFLRRNPRHLYTPRRLVALARLRLRAPTADLPSLPEWLSDRSFTAEEMRAALDRALPPGIVDTWSSLPALEGAASIIAAWHRSSAATMISGTAGRALSMAWPYRQGLTSGYYLMPAIGFLGHAHAYRPDMGQWSAQFREGCLRAADWGLKLHARLVSACGSLNEFAPPRRSTSHLPGLSTLLIERPAVGANDVAKALDLTSHGGRALLLQLHDRGLIQEVTGRRSFRLYAV